MADSIETLGKGDEETVGGEGTTTVKVGARNYRQRIDVIAYHNGVGPGGQHAAILLTMNGVRLGNPEDRNFDNYYLDLRRTLILEAGASASFQADFTNSGATTTLRDLIATIRHI